ncbi:hypothetical protein IWQ60_007235 [Tieghemiomyces parasiticus]|uniref:CRIB domain-containing protein n=1 Tax=Tieghemiomyces parasiticus TaxID=78921 RepID=A0A9W8DVD3_9FUNG|nr:hypothetical protein IWQ60_007235 [Tieghemiomyces parasiticus]
MAFGNLLLSCLGYSAGMESKGLMTNGSHKRKRETISSKRDLRKLVISSPSNFRHTTHMGIGGSSMVAPQEKADARYSSAPRDTSETLLNSPPLYPCKRISLQPDRESSSLDLSLPYLTYVSPGYRLDMY